MQLDLGSRTVVVSKEPRGGRSAQAWTMPTKVPCALNDRQKKKKRKKGFGHEALSSLLRRPSDDGGVGGGS
jgi:hypothetical protein